MPYIAGGDPLFWKVVQQKLAIVPALIDRIDDNTATKAPVPYFGGQYTIGDVAYDAIKEIIQDIPTFKLLGVSFDTTGCGYCAYWKHVRKSRRNRVKFREAVRNWYNKNASRLVWVQDNQFVTCDCSGPHPNGGHYELKK